MPQAEGLGLPLPDPALRWNPERGAHDFTPPDWAEFNRVISGELAAGYALTCQASPVTDRLVIDY